MHLHVFFILLKYLVIKLFIVNYVSFIIVYMSAKKVNLEVEKGR
jgi:hypothetical protein